MFGIRLQNANFVKNILMVTRDLLKIIIQEGKEIIRDVQLHPRPFQYEPNARYVMVGVRQAGKSYTLYQIAKTLIVDGYDLDQFVYLDFDDERLIGMKSDEFDFILQAHSSSSVKTPVFFFDEIQNVEGWEHFARRLANRKFKVYISGSNAKMLSREIQTTLGGRYLESRIFPYSFNEYLGAKGIILTNEWEFSSQRHDVKRHFDEYFKWGGFPELLLFNNKRKWLNGLYEKILLNDIMLRNNVKNEMAIRLTFRRLAESVMMPVSYTRISNLIKAAGSSASVSTVSDYVKYGKEGCFIFSLENYAAKFSEKETVKKHYFIDNGLLNVFMSQGNSPLLENLIAIDLYRKYNKEVYFYHNDFEVDFFLPEQKLAIQVAYSVLAGENINTLARELTGLDKLSNRFPDIKLMIVTFDEEGQVKSKKGNNVEIIPAWKFLIS